MQEKYHGTRLTLELNFVKKVPEKNEGKNIHIKQKKKSSPSWIIWNISLSTTISQNGIFEFRNLTFFRNTDIGT